MDKKEDPSSGCPYHDIALSVRDACTRLFQQPLPDGTIPRQAHQHMHACLRGELEITPPSNPECQHGLIAKEAVYPAIVRFSSAFHSSDLDADGQGMAIKLNNVDGEVCDGAPEGQHDFIMLNQETSAFSNAQAAKEFFCAIDGIKKVSPLSFLSPRYLCNSKIPWKNRKVYLLAALDVVKAHATNRDLSRFTFNTITPYRLGESATRFICRPTKNTASLSGKKGLNYRKRLQRVLEEDELLFDFLLQPRIGETDSLDDAGVSWTGPLIKAGALRIFKQSIEEGEEIGQKIAYSPWNCLQAHEPLGSVNAIRRLNYKQSATNRKGDATFPKQHSGELPTEETPPDA